MLYSDRVRLRAFEREDLPRFVTWLNDPEVRAGISKQTPIGMAQEEKWFADVLQRPLDEHPLVIEARAEGGWQPIGSCGLHNFDWHSRWGLLGISIGEKSQWNQGYGTEAVRLLLRHAFKTLNLNRVWLQVFESNARAIRSYEKAGFVHEGRQRQAFFRAGRYEDVLIMGILAHEWRGRA
jgi:RimJ/RimL family protein N-acetyltransferase